MLRRSIKFIQNQKNFKKLTCLTAYTASIAKIIDNHVDIILIGDSVGTAIYGMKNTQSVTLDMMMNHGKAVVNSSKKAFTIIDMPYLTYKNKIEALKNAKKLLKFTGCQAVKLEVNYKDIDTIKYLVKNKIKVVSHIGVTPQNFKNFSKIRAVGIKTKEQVKFFNLAIELEKIGSCIIVLECMKESLSKKISFHLKIPTIGIGASLACDGQVLVTNDILKLGYKEKKLRFIKSYTDVKKIIEKATKKYCADVINKKFPNIKNTY